LGKPGLLGRVVGDIMRVLASFALVLTCLGVRVGAAATEVPLEVHGGALIVEATLNKRFTGRFLVDTGATYCVVTKDVARRAKVKGRIGGEKIRLITANGVIEAALGVARKVEVGSASARDVGVAVVDQDLAPHVDGILGLSFLGKFSYGVDSEAGVLRLER
jgi:clan AA aspartic protease (TIGR02281 family)